MATVPDSDGNLARCICRSCPSKPADDSAFYCAKGRSPESVRKRGCICGDCANYREYALKGGFFCAEGAAA